MYLPVKLPIKKQVVTRIKGRKNERLMNFSSPVLQCALHPPVSVQVLAFTAALISCSSSFTASASTQPRSHCNANLASSIRFCPKEMMGKMNDSEKKGQCCANQKRNLFLWCCRRMNQIFNNFWSLSKKH